MTGVAVPRVIHWWWDGPQVPSEYVRFRERWAELHPGWSLQVWDEARFLAEFENHPGTQLYRARGRWSPRAHEWGWKTNIARLLILQRLGGLWVDADLEPLKAVDPLIERLEASEDHNALAALEDRHHVNNAFLASPPDGGFISILVDRLANRVRNRRGKPSNVMTGPHYLTEMADKTPGLMVLERALIYPMHWSELDRRAEDFPAAYTLHHWHRKTAEKTQPKAEPKPKPERIKITAGLAPGGEIHSLPAVRRPRNPKEITAVNVPYRIRKIKGLTPENVAVALADLAAQVPAHRAIVELGVYQGRTTLFLAWGARQGHGARIWAVDPWDLPGERGPYDQNPAGGLGKHRKSFTDPGTRAWARYNVKALGYADQVTLVRGFSTEVAGRWPAHGREIGLLFVDGDHRYEAVKADVATWTRHLADDAMIAFDDYAPTHPEVIQAVDEMVSEGILEPVKIYHDRLAVTRLGSGHPELVRRELERATAPASEEPPPEEGLVARGGTSRPLPPGTEEAWQASQGDGQITAVTSEGIEREHPGTGEPMGEGQEGTPDGTEHTLTTEETAPVQDRREASVPPAEGRPIEPAGKAETVPAAAGYHPVDDANLPLDEWAVPGELGLAQAVRLADLTLGQLKALAKERGVTLGREGKTRPVALARLAEAAKGE